jgi:hypothetical protein
MRKLDQRQTRNIPLTLLALFMLSCVSRTTPESRMRQSLSQATTSNFSIAGGNSAPFSFAMVGDLHIGSGDTARLTRILNAAAAEGDQFILFLGDIVDSGEDSDVLAFQNAVAAAGFSGKAFSVAGNHDIFFNGWETYLNRTGSSTYSFTAGNSKFIALDTADGTVGAPQTAWLREQLSGALPTHTFIFSHYSPVVPGIQTWLKLANETESLNLMTLCRDRGVRAWFGAHYHSYLNQTIGGVTYITAGGGGGRRMDPYREFFFVQASVNGDNVTYEVRRVD